MKVLVVEHYLPESSYILELAGKLKKYCDLSVYCSSKAEIQEEGVTWIPRFYTGGANKVKAVFLYGMSLLRLVRIIRKGKFDVVHVETFKEEKFEMWLYYRLRKHFRKMVHTVHNVLPHELKEKDKEIYGRFYDFCDELIVHNHASKQCLLDVFDVPESKVTVIPHGAYQLYQTFEEKEKEDTVKQFLQFGQIRKYKGIDILLDAVALIEPEKRKNMHFTIAGKQFKKLGHMDYEAKIKNLGIGDYVTFCNEYVPDEKIPVFFQNADFLLFPYRNIYGSGALLLAYTYHKPVIVSDIPTFREETDDGKTGLIFESENPKALADAIVKAAECSRDEINRFKDNIRRLVDERYDWEKSAVKTIGVYRK